MLKRLLAAIRARRDARRDAALNALKVRYHTFRILLDNNERALSKLAAAEAAMDGGHAPAELTGLVEDLEGITFELVDGLNRLTDGANQALYTRHLKLEDELRDALETLSEAVRPPSCLPLRAPLAGSEVGGKAAGLSLLTRNGFPVPDAFAVTAFACREFLRASGLERRLHQRLRGVGANGAAPSALKEAAAACRRDILEASLPEWLEKDLAAAVASLGLPADARLAVRSSALAEDTLEHSFAGQYATELNVAPENLGSAFLAVLSGAYAERALVYRVQAGLPAAAFDMAVLVQVMTPAAAAGVLFTVDPVDPDSGRMLVSAVPGLGVLAVNGEAPADIYRVSRADVADVVSRLAEKTLRAVPEAGGGIRREAVPEGERSAPILPPEKLSRLARLGLAAEALAGPPQDVEWALTPAGDLLLLQSRPARLAPVSGRSAARLAVAELFRGGTTASPGRCLGRVRVIRTSADLDAAAAEPVVAVLASGSPEAARALPGWQGAVVVRGNPADHLSTVARELGRPMLTQAAGAAEALADGAVVALDAGRGVVAAAPSGLGRLTGLIAPPAPTGILGKARSLSPARRRVRELTAALNLTDAYGPTFSIAECRSLHDVIRYAHEKAVLAMFEAGDETLAGAYAHVRRLGGDIPFQLMVIDLGGGLAAGAGRTLTEADIVSAPLAAFWRGLTTPGLRWHAPPPQANVGGVFSRGLLDGRGARPLGMPNYALVSRDYLNVNARVEFHFAMIDAVCGPKAASNHIRFRFKGGGTSDVQRQRRAEAITAILEANDFYADRRGDLVTAALAGAPATASADGLAMLGRLVGFTRLLDAVMTDDAAVARVVDAFLAGDYALDSFTAQAARAEGA